MKVSVKSFHIYIQIFLTLIFISYCIVATAADDPIDVKNDYSTLDNGLRVLIKRDLKDPMISLTVSFKFGAAYDIKAKDGYANYTFLVVNRMISKFYQDEYNAILKDDGASYQTDFGRDTVSFTTIFSKQNIDTILKIEAQRMSLQGADPDEFEAVKRLLMSDFLRRVGHSPGEEIKFNMRGAINNYWEFYHDYRGKEEDIQIARIQDIERFIKWYYAPSNAVIVIRGPLNKPEILAKIKDTFSPLAKSSVIPYNTASFSVSMNAIRLNYFNPELEKPAISFSYRIPPITHKDFPSNKVLYQLLFAEKESRLGGYFSASKLLHGYFCEFVESGGPNYMGVLFEIPGTEYYESMIDLVNENLKEIFESKISDGDFLRAKRRTIALNKESLSYPNYTRTIAKMLLVFAKPGDINSYFQSFNGLTRKNIIETAKIYLAETNTCIVKSEK